MILSITSQCNLACAGCYAAAIGNLDTNKNQEKKMKAPLSKDKWSKIIRESSELGVFSFVIAGGEPFLYPKLLSICQEFKNNFFFILTNGTAIKEPQFKQLKRLPNTAVIVSIEGGEEDTDLRRGQGVYEKAFGTLKRLNKMGLITGISVTITRLNYKYWMEEEHIDELIKQGIRLGIFIEYIPTSPFNKTSYVENAEIAIEDSEDLMLTNEERKKFRDKIIEFRNHKRVFLLHSPGDEELLGGCVSAGRGFAHVTPHGDLTPCPISDIATHNLSISNVKDGLASPLFEKIRNNETLILESGDTPCALFAHPKEVEELAKSVGAYKISQN
jgi:MoaA/NifB/PqqE/SkfB family radical SAM enzyme